jgi:YVTN family beta-propeller protein
MRRARRAIVRRACVIALGSVLLGSVPAAAGAAQRALASPPGAGAAVMRDVLLVGNNWDGTADVIDVRSYQRMRRINVVPDKDERIAEINKDPIRWFAYTFIRNSVGEGHDQYVDDMYASKDGRVIYASRPSFGDVVAIDVGTGQIRWRTRVDGLRADHMGISPDSTRLAVSASTAKLVDMIDTATGRIVGKFPSGDSPHENAFSRDGSKIFHASIGSVYTALDEPWLDWTKGERVLEIVDANTLKVLRKINISQKLADFGMPNMSSAVRPMALSPDERYAYLQVSFFHGFVEYDLEEDRVARVAHLPLSDDAKKLRRDQYILDSAHHGIAMSGDGTKLCVAGTMSDYAAIVSRESFRYKVHPLGARTYWATSSADGKYCYVSVAGDDTVSVLAYDTEQEIARIPVGDHPQRARTAKLAESALT